MTILAEEVKALEEAELNQFNMKFACGLVPFANPPVAAGGSQCKPGLKPAFHAQCAPSTSRRRGMSMRGELMLRHAFPILGAREWTSRPVHGCAEARPSEVVSGQWATPTTVKPSPTRAQENQAPRTSGPTKTATPTTRMRSPGVRQVKSPLMRTCLAVMNAFFALGTVTVIQPANSTLSFASNQGRAGASAEDGATLADHSHIPVPESDGE